MRRLISSTVTIMSLIATAHGLRVDVARADAAAETGMGVVFSETEMAASVCPGVAVDTGARAKLMAGKGIDPAKPSEAFKRGMAEADQRSSEAVANERLRSYCLEMREAYGTTGKSVPGLLMVK